MAKPRTADDYDGEITAASRSALAELMTVLGSYRKALVLIGGWAPYLILEVFGERAAFDPGAFEATVFDTGFVHVGSIDIDLVVDPAIIDEERYATIVELLLDRGYEAIPDSRYQFEKQIAPPGGGPPHPIRVDFLTPRPLPGEGRKRRHRAVQRDLEARTLAGAEVALAHWFWYELEAALPGGGQARTRLKVSDVVGTLALKGLAIGDRYAEKDADDIYAVCAHFRGGPAGVVAALKDALDDEIVRRGVAAIAEEFRARDAEGPTWVATFLGAASGDELERLRTDAFMTVNEVVRQLS